MKQSNRIWDSETIKSSRMELLFSESEFELHTPGPDDRLIDRSTSACLYIRTVMETYAVLTRFQGYQGSLNSP